MSKSIRGWIGKLIWQCVWQQGKNSSSFNKKCQPTTVHKIMRFLLLHPNPTAKKKKTHPELVKRGNRSYCFEQMNLYKASAEHRSCAAEENWNGAWIAEQTVCTITITQRSCRYVAKLSQSEAKCCALQLLVNYPVLSYNYPGKKHLPTDPMATHGTIPRLEPN